MNIGIAGAGGIVPTFLASQQPVKALTPYAICASSRSREKMEDLSARYGIAKIYYSYHEMIEDPNLDVIYIAVPNHLHYEFTGLALEKGLHVICEKPFCTKSEELESLISLAEEKQLFLFEAISNQYFPNYQKVRELLPELGRIRIIDINYSQYSSRYDAFLRGEILPAFDPEKSGGALMDLNVYNIHFVTGLFGKPDAVQYFPNMQRGIDTSGVLILNYPDFVCTLTAAKDCQAPCRISIQGEKGCIVSDSPPNVFSCFTWEPKEGEHREFALNAIEERLYYELQAFAEMADSKDFRLNREQLFHSLLVQKILDRARGQAGL